MATIRKDWRHPIIHALRPEDQLARIKKVNYFSLLLSVCTNLVLHVWEKKENKEHALKEQSILNKIGLVTHNNSERESCLIIPKEVERSAISTFSAMYSRDLLGLEVY
jgi:hypothetical protein